MCSLAQTPFEEDLADLIYEAAFEPDRWPEVLDRFARLAGFDSGAVMTYRGVLPIGGRATGMTQQALVVSMATSPDSTRRRMAHCLANPIFGFVDGATYFPPETHDVVDDKRAELGLHDQVGTIIRLANDELAVMVLDRGSRGRAISADEIDLLNRYHAHFARAALIAARLDLERAQATTAALNALGVPAAVLSQVGRVRASNALLETMSGVVVPLAFGGVALAHAPANRLFQEALAQLRGSHEGAVRSIPIPAGPDGKAFVVHMLPLRRSAYDMFSGADVLVAVTQLGTGRASANAQVLMGLFDLTPAEARLARALVGGLALKEAATDCGVRVATARSYLDQIFRKTGTHRQSELVSLLGSAQPPG